MSSILLPVAVSIIFMNFDPNGYCSSTAQYLNRISFVFELCELCEVNLNFCENFNGI